MTAARRDADFDAVYRVLHRLAGRQMRGARAPLDRTGLVHEAWMKVSAEPREFESRGHYLAVAATAMRQIVVDHARRRGAKKRGGGGPMTITSLSKVGVPSNVETVLAIDAALGRLDLSAARRVHDAKHALSCACDLRFGGVKCAPP